MTQPREEVVERSPITAAIVLLPGSRRAVAEAQRLVAAARARGAATVTVVTVDDESADLVHREIGRHASVLVPGVLTGQAIAVREALRAARGPRIVVMGAAGLADRVRSRDAVDVLELDRAAADRLAESLSRGHVTVGSLRRRIDETPRLAPTRFINGHSRPRRVSRPIATAA